MRLKAMLITVLMTALLSACAGSGDLKPVVVEGPWVPFVVITAEEDEKFVIPFRGKESMVFETVEECEDALDYFQLLVVEMWNQGTQGAPTSKVDAECLTMQQVGHLWQEWYEKVEPYLQQRGPLKGHLGHSA